MLSANRNSPVACPEWDSAAPRPPAALLFDPLPQPGEEPEPQQKSVSGACPPPHPWRGTEPS